MTRETKIGLLTGLGVIILIGVLLSQYLGGPNSTNAANLSSMGDPYRQRQLQPVGIDPVIKPQGTMLAGVDSPGAGGSVSNAVLTGDPQLSHLPTGTVASSSTTPSRVPGPTLVSDPVSPEPAGSISSTDTPSMPPIRIGTVNTLTLDHTTYVPGDPAHPAAIALGSNNGVSNMPTGTFIAVAKGDTLSSISKHYYHAATKTNFAKIVAANPTLLKNEKTTLQVGEKLFIPDAPAPVAAAPAPTAPTPPLPGPTDTLVLRPDGGPSMPAVPPVAVPPTGVTPVPVIKTPTTYTVQAGDTLGKIAKKFLGSSSNLAIKKIVAMNKIEDPDALQIGMILHIPAKAAS